MKNKLTAREAREMLLSGSSEIIKDLIICATGDKQKDHPNRKRVNVDEKARKTIVDAIIPMMHQAGDIQKIRATNSSDILKLLRRGKITLAESKELMSIMKDEYEITQAPELMAKLEELVNKE